MQTPKRHILLIDDNADLLLMIKTILTMRGYNVSVKENTVDVPSAIRNLLPDIILMDMLLGGADGRQLCSQLKAETEFAHIPVVMFSAHSDAKEECLKAGADFFIAKPFDIERLLEVLSIAAG